MRYYYDPNGNQIAKTGESQGAAASQSGGPAFGGPYELSSYNALGQLTSVETNDHLSVYSYNPNGLRHSKKADGETRVHIWDGANIIAETDGTDLIASYTRGIGLLWRSAQLSDLSVYLYNAHGDVVGLVGTLELEYDYDAFGNELGEDKLPIHGTSLLAAVFVFRPLGDNPFMFCGEYFDSETGTYYLRARIFSPVTGRFTAEDPIGAGFNWYNYCNNNPILFIDPWGLDAWVFYLPQWEDEAIATKQDMMDYYGLTYDQVHLIAVETKSDLTNGWNSMGVSPVTGQTVTIDAVFIDTHGTPEHLSGFSANWWDATFFNGERFTIKDIEKLQEKDVGVLIILGCNAGHLDYVGKNVASAFAKKVKGAPVIASDGLAYGRGSGDYFDSTNEGGFAGYLKKNSTRDNSGWVVYQYQHGDLTVSSSLGKSLTVTDMLRAGLRYPNLNKPRDYWPPWWPRNSYWC